MPTTYDTILLRRGLEANRTNITPAQGEPLYTIDTQRFYIGDGTTPGGNLITGSGVVSLNGLSNQVLFSGVSGASVTVSGQYILVGGNTGQLTGEFLIATNNLSDITNTGTALKNLGAAYNQDVVKNTSFTVTTAQRGQIFEIATTGSNVTVTLPSAATAGNGFFILLRKSDSAAGIITTSPTTSPAATSLGVQGHALMIWTDGTNYYSRAYFGVIDSSGNISISTANNGNITLSPNGTGQVIIGAFHDGVQFTYAEASLDQKYWNQIVNDGNIALYAYSDTKVQGDKVFQFDRSGTDIMTVNFNYGRLGTAFFTYDLGISKAGICSKAVSTDVCTGFNGNITPAYPIDCIGDIHTTTDLICDGELITSIISSTSDLTLRTSSNGNIILTPNGIGHISAAFTGTGNGAGTASGTIDSGTSQGLSSDNSFRELRIIWGGDSSNVLALQNPVNTGYSAVAFRDHWGNEHAAFGLGQNAGGGAFAGAAYIESSDLLGATTQTASWVGVTNTVTLSGTNSAIRIGMLVTGTSIVGGSTVSSISGTTVVLTGQGTTGTGSGVTLTFGGQSIQDIRFVQTGTYGGIGSGNRSYVRQSITVSGVDFWQLIPITGTGATTQVSNLNINDTGITFGVPINATSGPLTFTPSTNSSNNPGSCILFSGDNSSFTNSFRPIVINHTGSSGNNNDSAILFQDNGSNIFQLGKFHASSGVQHFQVYDLVNNQYMFDFIPVTAGASTFGFTGYINATKDITCGGSLTITNTSSSGASQIIFKNNSGTEKADFGWMNASSSDTYLAGTAFVKSDGRFYVSTSSSTSTETSRKILADPTYGIRLGNDLTNTSIDNTALGYLQYTRTSGQNAYFTITSDSVATAVMGHPNTNVFQLGTDGSAISFVKGNIGSLTEKANLNLTSGNFTISGVQTESGLGTGLLKVTSGLHSVAAAGTDYIVPGGVGYAQTLFTQTNSTGPSATTSETALTGTGTGTLTIPVNRLVAGSTIRYKLSGYLATTLTPTIQVKAKLGSTIISDTGAQALVAITGNGLFTISGEITCRTSGGSGTVIGQGMTIYYSGAAGLNGIQATPSTSTTTIDTTATQAFSVTIQFGASTGNSATCTNATIEILN